MAKEGIYRSKTGYDVYVNGKNIGWYRNLRDAGKDYREEKERIRKRAEEAAKVPPQPAGPSRLSKIGSGLKSGASYAGGKIKGAHEKVKAAHDWATGGPSGEPNITVGWIFFFLSLLLYFFIDWKFGYGGIDIDFFFEIGGIGWIWKSGILTIILIILAFQFTAARPKSKEEWEAAVFLDVIVAIVFILAGYSHGAFYHFLFILGMWFFLIRPVKDRVSSYKIMALIILIDFVGFSALRALLDFTGVVATNVTISYMVFPIFSLYLLYYLNVYGRSKLARVMLFIVICLYVFGFMQYSPQYQTLTAELETKEVEEAWGFWKTSFARFRGIGAIFIDPVYCSSVIGTVQYDECLKTRQYERLCVEHKKGTDEYEQCINQKKGLDVAGATDATIKEYTKIEFKKPSEFPQQIQKEFSPAIPMQLNIESPKKSISAELSCRFKTTGKEEIQGIIQPEKIEPMTGTKKQTIFCSIPSGKEFVEGRFYTVEYEAKIEGIETESTLTRLFAGKVLEDSEKSKLLSLHKLSIKEDSKSAKEFAVFSFGIGTPPTHPFIDDNAKQPIIGNIENIGNGEILGIENIEVNLIEGVRPTKGCLNEFIEEERNVLVLRPEVKEKLKNLRLKKGEKRFLLGCYLDISSDLAKTEDYVKRGFSSKITYSYAIKTEERFSIAKTPSLIK